MIVLRKSYECDTRSESTMVTTRLSSKGQVIIPKEIRSGRGWRPGLRFIVEETDDGILLRPMTPFAETRVEEVLGCTGYKGPRRSLKDMEAAIAKGIREGRR